LSVDDLRTWQGVVLGRAVSTLRSVETQRMSPLNHYKQQE
jgi:hypothetical protein